MKGSRATAAALVIGGIVSVQVGAAIATTLFDEVGPGGAVFLRILFAALVLVAIWRPALRLPETGAKDVVALGLILGLMNLSFYESLDRIPLGIAVTIEFVGPLTVAVIGSRRRFDLLWVALAAAGLLLLAPVPGSDLDALGCAFALFAGACWGLYIPVTARVGRAVPGGSGLAIAMAIAVVVALPFGLADGAADLLDGELLAIAFGVAILSSAIPYSFELEALRRLPQSTFGVLMSLEPAVAAAAGFIVLGQDLSMQEAVAIGLVLTASAGALSAAGRLVPEA
ncbi:MAG: inner rane transporter RhtA [Solirubrobacterales bacterium]|nr:inner rane transporter RhtA [Solirubrobacterales bacterium]